MKKNIGGGGGGGGALDPSAPFPPTGLLSLCIVTTATHSGQRESH